MGISRRDFMKLAGTAALSALAAPLLPEQKKAEAAVAAGEANSYAGRPATGRSFRMGSAEHMTADTLFLGRIVTINEHDPYKEALAVRDGKVLYIGSAEYAKRLCDSRTKVIDYGENYIYPGFADAHCHGCLAGARMLTADLTSGQSLEDYAKLMQEYIRENPENSVYVGAGWIERDKAPTAAILDAVCADKPVVLHSGDGHSMWLNTAAMKKYNIDRAAAQKWGTSSIRVDSSGEPTGYISEGMVFGLIMKVLFPDVATTKRGLLKWQEFALTQGITAYYEAAVWDMIAEAYKELVDEGKWKLRTYAGWMIDEHVADYPAAVREAKAKADYYNSEHFQIINVKLFMDGVVEAHTAWLLEDYADEPGYKGVKRFCDLERTVELYKEANRCGLSVHQHTIGDAAVKFALDCIERAQLETGNMDMRNAMAHLQVMRPEDIARMGELNVVPVVAPLWMQKEKYVYVQSEGYLGKERAFHQYPLKSFLNHSASIAFHSDYPVSPSISIPLSIYMACERNVPGMERKTQLNPKEGLSRFEALYGVTYGPFYSFRQEDRQGMLDIGYIANLTVYDKNFLTENIKEVPKAKLLATVVDGEELYRAK